uniref:Scavenger receptor class B, member 2a n=1 Tax=Petromyzon marinus TaxID=7757 RepID=S4RAT2_PETMA
MWCGKGSICAGTAAVCIGITWVILFALDVFPNLAHSMVKEQVVLKLNSTVYENWKNPPADIYLSFTLFHLVNPKEVLGGEKPLVQERGPYTYREMRIRQDIVFYENHTVSATLPKSYVLVPEQSVGDPMTDKITTVNIPLMTLVEMVRHSFLPQKWLDIILTVVAIMHKETLFQSRTVHELLWGYEDPILAQIHKFLDSVNPNFGLFYGMNGSADGVYLFHTGQNKSTDFAKIALWKGESSLNWWTTDSCNKINGTDGSTFHPLINKNDILYLFSSDLCRSIYVSFEKELSVKALSTYRFTTPASVFANSTANHGFCTTPSHCPGSGVLNISVCKQAALLITFLPSFVQNKSKFAQRIQLNPPSLIIKEAQEVLVTVSLVTGFPLRAEKKVQINVHVQRAPNILQTGNVRTLLFPVVFINESALIKDDSAAQLRSQILEVHLLSNLHYVLLALSIVLALVATGLLYRAWSRKGQVAPRLKSANSHLAQT